MTPTEIFDYAWKLAAVFGGLNVVAIAASERCTQRFARNPVTASGLGMSERYTGFDPAYQREAVASLDRLLSFILSPACPLRASSASAGKGSNRAKTGSYQRLRT